MSSDASLRDPLDLAVEAYLARRRAGCDSEGSIDGNLPPALVDELRELAPLLDAVQAREQFWSSANSSATDVDSTMQADFGDFQLIREIGRGGMGIVFEAEQKSLRRLVGVEASSSIGCDNSAGPGNHRAQGDVHRARRSLCHGSRIFRGLAAIL